jgi:tetrapyrrole methylase family protein/MazG family protein
MQRLTIIGLGTGNEDQLTLGAYRVLKQASCVVLRTGTHPIIPFLKDEEIAYRTLDCYYDVAETFEAAYDNMAKDIIMLLATQDVVLAVPGHPQMGDAFIRTLLDKVKKAGYPIKMMAGISRGDYLLELETFSDEGVLSISANSVKIEKLNPRINTIITELNDQLTASDVKLALQRVFPDEHQVVFSNVDEVGNQTNTVVALYEIDQQKAFSHTSALLIPSCELEALTTHDVLHLNEVMGILRSPEGCPWDNEQTHDSLKECLIEETYEVLEAIDEQDPDMLMEELGDLLLQVVFHAKIAQEHSEFDLYDISSGITQKMIERHTHIFGDASANTADEVVSNWEKIKKDKKGYETQTEVLQAIPKQLPSLMRSYKVQKKAAQVGFDWDSVQGALDKVDEEILEVKEAIKENEGIEEEIGDLLFAVVNVARFMKIQPELALSGCIGKFIRRFSYIEEHAGKPMEQMKLVDMEKLWVLSKKVLTN